VAGKADTWFLDVLVLAGTPGIAGSSLPDNSIAIYN